MAKVKEALLGQEVLPIDSPSPSMLEELGPTGYVNTREGIVLLEDLPADHFDPERPMGYLEFMGEIGVVLAEEPPKSPTWDGELDTHGDDYRKASIDNLIGGLYFGSRESIARTEVVTVGKKNPSISPPGVRGREEGVAMTGDEFRAIARSPWDLAKHIHAKTREANEKRSPEEKLDDETLTNTAGRSIAHGLRSKKEELLKLDKELIIERIALSAVHNLAAGREIPGERSLDELDWYRRVSAIAIHKTVKVASDQLGYGTTVRSGINRALVSTFYRSDYEVRSAALQNYTKWAGYYIDAKRGKINQSLQVCAQAFYQYSHFLRTKQQES